MTLHLDPTYTKPRVSRNDRFTYPVRPYRFGASPIHLRPVLANQPDSQTTSERNAVPLAGGYVRA